jgi:hypothetical protein
MKPLSLALLLAVLACACSSPVIHLDVQYDLGESRTLESDAADRTAKALEELLASCKVDASGGPGYTQRWAVAIQGPHVTVRYEEPEVITKILGKPMIIEQILLPVPRDHLPDYIWVRANGKLRSLTKYPPSKLAAVVCDEELELLEQALYAEFCASHLPPDPIDP